MAKMQLTVVTIGARNLPQLRRFYWAWGWESDPAWDTDSYASFTHGGIGLALYPLELLAEEAAPRAPIPPEGMWSGWSLAVHCPSRQAVIDGLADAAAAGANEVAEPVVRDWGGFSGYVADPEGNRWELVWSPHRQSS